MKREPAHESQESAQERRASTDGKETARRAVVREFQEKLSRRERQIMDILFERGSIPASEIRSRLPDPPSYSAVRAALRVLERKGHIRHELQGLRYVWTPRLARDRARRSALRHLVRTFFDGSVEQTVAALLNEGDLKLDEDSRTRLKAMIEAAGEQNK